MSSFLHTSEVSESPAGLLTCVFQHKAKGLKSSIVGAVDSVIIAGRRLAFRASCILYVITGEFHQEIVMKEQHLTTRRGFLRRSAVAAGSAFALPAIVPPSVFGANAPSNRIVMGAIGVGSQGTGDMRGFLGKSEVQMVSVCDVDKGRGEYCSQLVWRVIVL